MVALNSERGFTLIELLIVVALVVIIAGVGVESLAQRPAQARSTAVTFAALIAEAGARAALSPDGTSIAVTSDAGASVATLYVGRPIRGAAAPAVAERSVPLRTPTTIVLGVGTTAVGPPFALFFSPAGHVSALGAFRVGTGITLAQEPDCPLASGIVLGFRDGVHDQRYTLGCEMPRLDLDHPTPESEAATSP
jgi:prepilin-type N-terminal cleavage/methylation domain-containing protein